MESMDKIDEGILALLQKNAHLTSKEIADRLHLSVTPIYERIKKLEQKGIIRNYVALLDKEKINRSMIAFCAVSLKVHSKLLLVNFEKAVNKLDEVMECYHIAGTYDYLMKVVVKDMNSYQQFIVNKLAVMENIGNVQSSFVMTEIKYETAFNLGSSKFV
ncbi:MAG TPA: Lrp/AsnC family transcriptional regulator [Bacteroidia bacterium]|nr:Lrp/AsnC family transcriptional regulator [Bacteroidia bacterium]